MAHFRHFSGTLPAKSLYLWRKQKESDMRKIQILALLSVLLWGLGSCRDNTATKQKTVAESEDTAAVVLRLQQCARIYSTEYKIHKIVTNSDAMYLEGNLITKKMNVRLPSSSRKIAIPVDVVIKGYTELNRIKKENIRIKGKTITIVLPDPEFDITSVRIDRENIVQTSDLMRSRYQEQDINRLTRQGVESIRKDIPWDDFLETARSNAAYTLFPLLQAMGFEQIHIQYRDELKNSNKDSLLLFKNIEEKAS